MLAVDVAEVVTARTGAARWFYDWQGLLGVLAAFVLVGVTIMYVLLTRTMSKAATDNVALARDNVKLAREAVQQAKDNVGLTRESVQQSKEDIELTREAVRQTTAAVELDRERWVTELNERDRWQAQLISLQFAAGLRRHPEVCCGRHTTTARLLCRTFKRSTLLKAFCTQ